MKKKKVCLLAFYDNQGYILLNHRKSGLNLNEDYWEIIGGGIEQNEQPQEAIKREIKEELNYDIGEEEDELNFVQQFQFTDKNVEFEVYFFKAKFPGFHKFADSSEVFISNLKTFSLEEALNLNLLPICRYIIEVSRTKP